jgi:hypothetical protein
MNLTDELRKLSELHRAGQLTDQEFSDAKRRLIAENQGQTSPAPLAREPVTASPGSRAGEKTFQSSRWSTGNLFFPDRLTMADDGMLFRKGALFGSSEEHISYQAVASFRVTNGIFLSNISIETSGGSQPIFMNGLWKSDAREIQDRLRAHQKEGVIAS